MEGEAPRTRLVGNSTEFDDCIAGYSRQLGTLLMESPWSVRTQAAWARRDPELQKILARLYGALQEITRLNGPREAPQASLTPASRNQSVVNRMLAVVPELSGRGILPETPVSGTAGISGADQHRIQQMLAGAPDTLTLDAAIELFDGLDRILVQIGDAEHVCAEIAGELQWPRGSTTWLTWQAMHGATVPEALKAYHSGKAVPAEQLEAARRQLLSFRTARSDDYQVHRARQKMRARNLHVLAGLLVVIVVVFAWRLAAMNVGGVTARGVWLVAIAGSLGSVMSGTLNARDKLVRGSDLRAFRAGLMAQVLLGSASALVVLLLLASEILEIAGTNTLEGKAVLGFVAGFSEPFFLKTVARVAKLGDESEQADKPAKQSEPGPVGRPGARDDAK